MPRVSDLACFLEEFAPPALAEAWDNVGLLVGDPARSVERVMTCLTITPASAREAIESSADLIVTHHPLPFRPLKRLTSETNEGRLLVDLMGAKIGIFSPHTAFDSARQGINQRLAEGLGLQAIGPLVPTDVDGLGSGRQGRLPGAIELTELAQQVKSLLAISQVQVVGPRQGRVQTVGVACGSGGEFLPAAKSVPCDCLLTGEARFHTCLEAEALGISLLLVGHFASERFAVEQLADVLARKFPSLQIWASKRERDPLHWL